WLALRAMLLGDVVDQEASGLGEHRFVIGVAQRVARRVDGLMRALERAVSACEVQARLQIREALAIRFQRACRELELAEQRLEARLVIRFDERDELVVSRDAAASFLLARRRSKQLLPQRAVLSEARATVEQGFAVAAREPRVVVKLVELGGGRAELGIDIRQRALGAVDFVLRRHEGLQPAFENVEARAKVGGIASVSASRRFVADEVFRDALRAIVGAAQLIGERELELLMLRAGRVVGLRELREPEHALGGFRGIEADLARKSLFLRRERIALGADLVERFRACGRLARSFVLQTQ